LEKPSPREAISTAPIDAKALVLLECGLQEVKLAAQDLAHKTHQSREFVSL